MLGMLPKLLGFPYNISATAEVSNFKIGMLLGFAKAHHKISLRKRWTWLCAIGAPQILGFPFNICATAEASDETHGPLNETAFDIFCEVGKRITACSGDDREGSYRAKQLC